MQQSNKQRGQGGGPRPKQQSNDGIGIGGTDDKYYDNVSNSMWETMTRTGHMGKGQTQQSN